MSAAAAIKQQNGVFSASPLANSELAADITLAAPEDAPPSVKLSGNIISATFLTPYTFGYRQKPKRGPGCPTWELTPRRGSSALYDTLKHLASPENKWNHTIIGWTGEITEISSQSKTNPWQHMQNSRLTQAVNPPPANNTVTGRPTAPNNLWSHSRSYAIPPPVPVFDGSGDRMTMKADYTPSHAAEEQFPRINKEGRKELQAVLAEKCRDVGWDKIRTVWLGDEEGGGISLTGMDRWMKYAEKGS